MKIKIYLFIILFLFSVKAYTSVTIKASVSQTTVGLGSAITYQITVSGDQNVPSPKLPSLPDFDISGRGNSTSISIINGKMSSSKTYNYVLIPKKEGEFTIPPSEIDYKGQVYKTESFQIKVLPSSKAPHPQANQPKQQPDPFDDIWDAFFDNPIQQRRTPIRAHSKAYVSRHTVYVGQQLLMTDKLFFNGRANLRDGGTELPVFDGFLVEDVQRKDNTIHPEKNQVIKGVTYTVFPIIKKILFPLSPGIKKIGPAKIRIIVSFFMQGIKKELPTNPITIKVLPLPKPQPPQFSGSVGQFAISASVKKTKYKQNEGIGLKITISGVGNIKAIEKPILPDLSNFKIYKSSSSVQIDTSSGYMQGKKTFEYILTPLKSGAIRIPAFRYIYFNPNTKKYVTIKTKSISLQIKAVSKSEMNNIVYPEQSDIQLLNTDIAYIKTDGHLKSYSYLYKSKTIQLIMVFELLLTVLGVGYYFYKKKMETNVEYARKSRAYLVYKKKYNKLKKHIQTNNFEHIVSGMEPLLLNYVADKMNLSKSKLILENIVDILKNKKVSQDIIDELESVIEDVQMMKYAPVKKHQKETINEMLLHLNNVVTKIENAKLI